MLRILICDDDGLFLQKMRKKIRAILDSQTTEAAIFCATTFESIPQDYIDDCDIAFLDVDLGNAKYNGLDLAKRIRASKRNAVIIFVSNYIEYAPEGYEVHAFRYVLKENIDGKLKLYLRQAMEKTQDVTPKIQLVVSGETTTFELANITHFEANGHKVILHLYQSNSKSERTCDTYSTLTQLEKDLEQSGFLRIQKSYLVNVAYIQRLRCDSATLSTGITLPVSSKNYSTLKNKFLLLKGKR